jgi:glycosyltransferase involved in cell wall biosynthesis
VKILNDINPKATALYTLFMKNEVKFSVVIPTRNRSVPLINLLNRIINQSLLPYEIIIVDSSEIKQSTYEDIDESIRYIHTSEKSAARQRNIGMSHVKEETQILFFLDDDTNPNSTYFESMLDTLFSVNAIGVSGLAINHKKVERIKPSGLVGFFKKISFLDSDIDGKVLMSGVGIPVRNMNAGIIEVEWLIGCSCWDFKKIKKLKFEEDFKGYSLGEDVIFSVNARKLGKLFVNSKIILEHTELPQADSNIIKHNYMWVYYRFRLSKYVDNKIAFYPAFYLSTLFKVISSLLSIPISPIMSIKQIIGTTLGLINIFRDIFK